MGGRFAPLDGVSRPLVDCRWQAPHVGDTLSAVMLRDARLACRLIIRHPALSVAIALTLAIAIGAATAIFSLVQALVLRPLPFANAGRLVTIEAVVDADAGRVALREYRDLVRDARMFDGWAAYYRSQYNLTGAGAPQALTCTIGTSTLFDLLGVRPVHGDIWSSKEDFTRQYRVVLSHRLWRERFGGRPSIVGSTLVMDGGSYQVSGVLPAGFDYPLQTDVFRAITDYNAPHVRRYSVLARMRTGASLDQVQAELDSFAARFARMYPDTNVGVTLRATPLREAYVGRARPYLWLLVAAVGLLTVIACVNVTNLLLSRAIASSGDIAVRLAMGARSWHLVRLALAEALLPAVTGAALGGVGGWWALRGLTAMIATDLPPWLGVGLDVTAWLFAASTTLLTAVAVVTLPVAHAARTDVGRVLRQESNRSAGSRAQQTTRRLLLGGQAAFATLLLVMAALFGAALRELLRADTGFDSRGVLTFRVDPPWGRYPDIATTSEFYRRSTERLTMIPGVEAAGANNFLPFSGLDVSSPRVLVEGRVSGRADEEPFINFQVIDAGYLRAMGVPLLQGRTFVWTDEESSPPVAVVSRRTAQRFWPGEEALGRRIRVVWNQHGTGGGGGSDVWLTVVGVVGNVRFSSLDDDAGLEVYAANTQLFAGDSYIVVRARTGAEAVRQQLRPAIDAVDREQSFFDVQTMDARIQRALWQHRVATAVLAVFAAIALCLAVIGTHAVTAQAVASARREIGIRLALGSPVSQIVRLVMQRWLGAVVVGVAVGTLGGVLMAGVLARALGMPAVPDLLLPGIAPIVLAGAAAVACYVPVRRALRQHDLIDALRPE
ncbi:MAG: ADOP family duplicated permease [Vicinamibacteraceae bacterium]